MGLNLVDLDERTRRLMLEELELDLEGEDTLYRSGHLTGAGCERYPALLRAAIMTGDDQTLAAALGAPGIFQATCVRRRPRGGYSTAKIRVTTPRTLAEGEFNRFYLRALCRRVLAAGRGGIELYRARPSEHPQARSEALVGARLDPELTLADLRVSTLAESTVELGLPNSGLSARIVP